MKFVLTWSLALAAAVISAIASAEVYPTNVVGTVTFWYGGANYAFMRLDDGRGVRLGLAAGQRPNPGDVISVTGLVHQVRPTMRMEYIDFTVIGHSERPLDRFETSVAVLYRPPVEGDASRPDLFGIPVSLMAQVRDVNRRRTQVQLVVSDPGTEKPCLIATYPLKEGVAIDPDLKPGAIVTLRGVPSMEYDVDETGAFVGVKALTLNIRGAYDVGILVRSPWWTPVKMWTAAGLAAVLLSLLAVWIVFLAKTAAARRRYIEAMERTRMERQILAADMHDTVEQNLATAKLYLTGTLSADGIPEDVREAIDTVSELLVRTKVQIRDVVSGLRGESVGSIKDELSRIAAQVEASGAARVRCALSALSDSDVADGVRQDVVSIVREAVTNAVKHGRPDNIVLVCDAAKDCQVLRVLNDGSPFDDSKALGPEMGHFGLAGMRERAARSGMRISFGREGRWTYTRLEVPR